MTLASRKQKRRKSVYGTMQFGFTDEGIYDLMDDEMDDDEEQAMEDMIKGVPATMATKRSLR